MYPLSYFGHYYDIPPYVLPMFSNDRMQSYRNYDLQHPNKVQTEKSVQTSSCIDIIKIEESEEPFEIPEKQNKTESIKQERSNRSFDWSKEVEPEQKTVQRNQTKNISKNFGKAILSFAKNYSNFCQDLLRNYGVDRQQLINYIKKVKKNLNSLQDLREMWGADDYNDRLKKCLRIISYYFMRKHCLVYIFNSRIKSTDAHTKYRYRLMQGMKNPSEFMNIKQ